MKWPYMSENKPKHSKWRNFILSNLELLSFSIFSLFATKWMFWSFWNITKNHENNEPISKEIKELALFGAAIILSSFLGPLVTSKKKGEKKLIWKRLNLLLKYLSLKIFFNENTLFPVFLLRYDDRFLFRFAIRPFLQRCSFTLCHSDPKFTKKQHSVH